MDLTLARKELTRGLQLAYSGELGAVFAYMGHARSLRGKPEREVISRILKDEIRHRRSLLAMLEELGSGPDATCEKKMSRVGRTISFASRCGGWFIPMYGAARLERDNIVEYELAARLAYFAGCEQFIDNLLEMGEVEWDHELALRQLASRHFGWKLLRGWTPPPPRESIRARYQEFRRAPQEVTRRKSWLMR